MCAPLQTNYFERKTPPTSATDLTPGNYKQQLTELVIAEMEYRSQELTGFTLRNEKLTHDTTTSPHETNLYMINVPGLIEQRPFVELNDVVIVRDNLDTDRQYHAVVFSINRAAGKLFLRMPPEWAARRKTESTCVIRFTLKTLPYREQIRAVEVFGNLLIAVPASVYYRQILFPRASDLPMMPMQRMDLAILECVANDPIQMNGCTLNHEQTMAVMDILNGVSNPVPYIILGPPGTGKVSLSGVLR